MISMGGVKCKVGVGKVPALLNILLTPTLANLLWDPPLVSSHDVSKILWKTYWVANLPSFWISVPVLNVKYKLGYLLAKKAGCCHRVNVILCWAKRGVTDDDVEWHLHFSTRAVVEKSKTCEAGFDWKWLQSFPELLFRGDCSIETMIVIGSSSSLSSSHHHFNPDHRNCNNNFYHHDHLVFQSDCSIETMIVIGSSNFVISQTTFFLWHPFPEKYLFAGLSN